MTLTTIFLFKGYNINNVNNIPINLWMIEDFLSIFERRVLNLTRCLPRNYGLARQFLTNPVNEAPTMELQVLPQDLEGVEFQFVERQVHERQAVFDQPFVQFSRVDVVSVGTVIQDSRISNSHVHVTSLCDVMTQ